MLTAELARSLGVVGAAIGAALLYQTGDAAYVANLLGEAVQWLACLFVVALVIDVRRLQRRVKALEGR